MIPLHILDPNRIWNRIAEINLTEPETSVTCQLGIILQGFHFHLLQRTRVQYLFHQKIKPKLEILLWILRENNPQ